MNDDPKPQGKPGERSQIVEEASIWCTRMHGREADQYRQAFADWLALGAVHRQIYSEVCELHGYAATLSGDDVHREDPSGNASPSPVKAGRWRQRLAALSVVGSIGLAGALGFHFWQSSPLVSPPAINRAAKASSLQLQTALGEKHVFHLDDGSVVTLDTDSLVTVAFNSDRRELRLEHGRARFDVTHESRPFIVDAGTGSIVAHGTIFDVSISADRIVHVHLFRGAVDVRTPDLPGRSARSPVTRLVPGEGTAYSAGTGPLPAVARQDVAAPDWPKGLIPFNATPLARVIEQANSYSAVKITLADPTLGTLPVYGTLRIDDIHMLAQTLAHQLELRVADTPDGITLSAP